MTLLNDLLVRMYRARVRGFHRTMRVLSACGRDRMLVSSTRYGARLKLDPNEYVDSCILRHGYYESEVFEALRPFMQAGGVFWDIGSNTGLHGISAKLAVPEMDVVCFEPAPSMVTRILENAALNGVSLSLCSFALGDEAGNAWLEVTPGNMGMSHIVTDRSEGTAVLCAVGSGDSLIARGVLRCPTVIKIDVEGHEQIALEGMRGTLANPALKAIVFEYYHDLEQHPTNPIHSMLVTAGFTLRKLIRQEPTSHPLDNYLAAR